MPLAVYPGYFIPFDIREVNNSHLPMMLNTSIPSPRKLCLAVLVIYDQGVHCIFGTSFSSEDFQKKTVHFNQAPGAKVNLKGLDLSL